MTHSIEHQHAGGTSTKLTVRPTLHDEMMSAPAGTTGAVIELKGRDFLNLSPQELRDLLAVLSTYERASR